MSPTPDRQRKKRLDHRVPVEWMPACPVPNWAQGHPGLAVEGSPRRGHPGCVPHTCLLSRHEFLLSTMSNLMCTDFFFFFRGKSNEASARPPPVFTELCAHLPAPFLCMKLYFLNRLAQVLGVRTGAPSPPHAPLGRVRPGGSRSLSLPAGASPGGRGQTPLPVSARTVTALRRRRCSSYKRNLTSV